METAKRCPNCEFRWDQEFSDCPRCGIVIEKFYLQKDKTPPKLQCETRRQSGPNLINWARSLEDRAFSLPRTESSWSLYAQAALLLLLIFWGASLALSSVGSNKVGESFLHNVNLVFHEAGHLLFSPLDQFVASAGGTLGQLLIPLICLVFFLKAWNGFAASVALWWLGENFLDIAPYINDARAGVLPLLGGNTGRGTPYGFHDWEYLLGETGLLQYDTLIATTSHFLGTVLMLIAVVWGGLVLYLNRNSEELSGADSK